MSKKGQPMSEETKRKISETQRAHALHNRELRERQQASAKVVAVVAKRRKQRRTRRQAKRQTGMRLVERIELAERQHELEWKLVQQKGLNDRLLRCLSDLAEITVAMLAQQGG